MTGKQSVEPAFPSPDLEEIISTKWCLPLLRALLAGPARFSSLKKSIPELSANVLTARLRLLARHGFVEQVRLPEPAARDVYALTEKGQAARNVIAEIDRWASAIRVP